MYVCMYIRKDVDIPFVYTRTQLEAARAQLRAELKVWVYICLLVCMYICMYVRKGVGIHFVYEHIHRHAYNLR